MTALGYVIFAALRAVLEWFNARFSKIGAQPFFDTARFSWIPEIESRWKLIQAEVLRLLPQHEQRIPAIQDIMPEQRVLSETKEWKAYMLYVAGHRIEAHCAECPDTARLLQYIPGLQTAFFSMLLPGKGLAPHRGVYNGLLRYHLALIVPARGECQIRVGKEWRHWEEGKSLVFDDTYNHEVVNTTDSIRVVLFVDLLRPLRPPFDQLNERLTNLMLNSPQVKSAIDTISKWRPDAAHADADIAGAH